MFIYRANMYCITTVPSQFWRELRHDTPEEEHARGEIFYSRGTHWLLRFEKSLKATSNFVQIADRTQFKRLERLRTIKNDLNNVILNTYY